MPTPAWLWRGFALTVRFTHATRPIASRGRPPGRSNSSSTRRPGASGSAVRTKAPPRDTLAQVSCEARKNGRPFHGSRSGSIVEIRTGSFASMRLWRRRPEWWSIALPPTQLIGSFARSA